MVGIARAEIGESVFRTTGAGQPIIPGGPGVSVQVNHRGGGPATVYAAETGGTTLANPISTDAAGHIEGWLEVGSYDLVISGTGITTYTARFEAIVGIDEAAVLAAVDSVETNLAGLWLDVMASPYNAAGNGTTDDTAAIEAALAALPATGGTIYFRPGKTFVWGTGATFSDKANVTLWGYGAKLKRKTGIGSPDVYGFGTYDNFDNFKILGLQIDHNNIERFGGFQINNSDGVTVAHTRSIDSNLNASWSSYDHYSFVIQGCTDVLYAFNYSEDIEALEFNNIDGIRIHGNHSRRAAGTSAIIHATVSDGKYLKNAKITNNTIIDARKQSLSIQHETSGRNDNTWTNIEISGNTIARLTSTGSSSNLMMNIGNFTGGTPTGNTYRDIRVERNSFYIDPSLSAHTQILLQFFQIVSQQMSFVSVKGNKFSGPTNGEWALSVRHLVDSDVSDNECYCTTHGLVTSNLVTSRVANNRARGTSQGYYFEDAASSANHYGPNHVIGTSTTPLNVDNIDSSSTVERAHAAHQSVALAANLTLPVAGSVFTITGTGTINNITAGNGNSGRRVTLIFASTPTVSDGAGNIKLNGNFVATADDTLELVCNGTDWLETSRQTN